MTAVGSFGIHITLSHPFPPTLSLHIIPPPLPQEDGTASQSLGSQEETSSCQASLTIAPAHLWDVPRGPAHPISGPNLDPSSTKPLASVVSATIPNAPFTSQVCPRPTYHLHPRCLLSYAAKSPSWLFLFRCHAPVSLLCPRPEIQVLPCSLLPPTAPQSSGPHALSIMLPKGLTRPSPSHPCCSALVWVSTPVSSLVGALPRSLWALPCSVCPSDFQKHFPGAAARCLHPGRQGVLEK